MKEIQSNSCTEANQHGITRFNLLEQVEALAGELEACVLHPVLVLERVSVRRGQSVLSRRRRLPICSALASTRGGGGGGPLKVPLGPQLIQKFVPLRPRVFGGYDGDDGVRDISRLGGGGGGAEVE